MKKLVLENPSQVTLVFDSISDREAMINTWSWHWLSITLFEWFQRRHIFHIHLFNFQLKSLEQKKNNCNTLDWRCDDGHESSASIFFAYIDSINKFPFLFLPPRCMQQQFSNIWLAGVTHLLFVEWDQENFPWEGLMFN